MVGIYKFLEVYRITGSIAQRPETGRASKVTAEIKKIVERQMQIDDNTTAHQLHLTKSKVISLLL